MREASADESVTRFFERRPEAEAIFDAVRELVADLGPVAVRVTSSQIAFARRRAFA